MDCQNILKLLRSGHFIKVKNKGNWFENGAAIYAKEIKKDIFLLFVILKEEQDDNIRALIAQFDDFASIGRYEPIQIMFYLSIKEKEDFHYFENFLKVSD